MVATADRKGYWLADATGRIFAFGDAAKLGSVAPPGGIRGMIAAPTGGLWMFTGAGGVISLAGAPNYGSLVVPADPSIVGMAATRDGRGYWFVNAAGLVIPFGDAARWRLYQPSHPVIGVVS
jgi:hypothetical protein